MSREGDGFFDGAFFQREEAKDENGWSMVCTTKFLCSTQKAEPDDSPGSQRADDESVALTDADGFEVDIVENMTCDDAAPGGRRLEDACAAEVYGVVVSVEDLAGRAASPRRDVAALWRRLEESPAEEELSTAICEVSATVTKTLAPSPAPSGAPTDAAAIARPHGYARKPDGGTCLFSHAEAIAAADVRPRTRTDAAAVARPHGYARKPVRSTRLFSDAATIAAADVRARTWADAAPSPAPTATRKSDSFARFRADPEADAASELSSRTRADAAAIAGAHGDARKSDSFTRFRADPEADAAADPRADGRADARALARAVAAADVVAVGSPAPASEVLFFFDFDDGTGTGYGQSTTDVMDDVPKLTGSKSRTLGAWLRIDAYDGAYILMIGGGQ
ncbi:hypothetical protein JL720_14167 [Aureococcus anophagefferens]|nr:hypothetical protein JL720_14167 [Aureococcus anophagefferens]